MYYRVYKKRLTTLRTDTVVTVHEFALGLNIVLRYFLLICAITCKKRLKKNYELMTLC